MKFKTALFALSAGAMTLAPVAAQAGTVASSSVGKVATLSTVGERSSTSIKKKNKAASGILIGALAAAAVVGGIIIVADDDDDSSNGS